MIWDIEFSQEASNYAIDSHPYNENVLTAVEQLAFNQDGLSTQGIYQLLGDWCIWEIANHTIVYQKHVAIFHIYIWIIKPTE